MIIIIKCIGLVGAKLNGAQVKGIVFAIVENYFNDEL